MQPLFLLFCLLLSINSLFAQSNAVVSEKTDTSAIVLLCSDSSGQQGFMVKNGKGQAEFQSVDQFVKSKAGVQSKNSLPRTVSEKAISGAASSSAKIKGNEAVGAGQSTGRNSNALQRHDKLPPVLAEGPPSHH
jgi:hypothetical protein